MPMSLAANSVDEVAAELGSLMKAKPPMSFREAIKLLGTAQIQRSAEQFDRFAETHRRLGFHQRAEFGSDFVHGIGGQAHGHALGRKDVVEGRVRGQGWAAVQL